MEHSKPLFLDPNPLFLGQTRVFRIYRIYRIIIESLFSQKFRSNSIFNQKFYYEFGTQGLSFSFKLGQEKSIFESPLGPLDALVIVLEDMFL